MATDPIERFLATREETARLRRASAQPPAPTAAGYLLCALGQDEYALSLDMVREIRQYRLPTPVPHAPQPVVGVILHRGEVLTIMDIRERLGQKARPPGQGTRIVVLTIQGRLVGLLVDRALRVLREPAIPLASSGDLAGRGLIGGLCEVGDRSIMILDLEIALNPLEGGPQDG